MTMPRMRRTGEGKPRMLKTCVNLLAMARGPLFLTTVVLYAADTLCPGRLLEDLLASAAVASMVAGFGTASRQAKTLTVLFLAAGLVLARTGHATLPLAWPWFGDLSGLLALFSIVPVLAIPVRLGRYERSVERLLLAGPALTPRYLFCVIAGLAYLMASLMNVAVIPLLYHTTEPLIRVRVRSPRRFILESIVCGYATALTWSPVAAVVAAVIHVIGISWLAVLPAMGLLSLVGLGLGVAWFMLREPAFALHVRPATAAAVAAEPPQVYPATAAALAADHPSDTSSPGRPIWHIAAGVVAFAVVLLSAQALGHWSMLQAIAIVCVPFAWAWSACIREQPAFRQALAAHRSYVQKLENLFTVFTAAGFFVQALSHSPFLSRVDHAFLTLSHVLGPYLLLALLPLLPMLLSLIGFHPMVSLSLFAPVLRPEVIHASPLWLAVALVGGSIITYVFSPFTATLNIASAVSSEPPLAIMRWNLPFCGLFLVVVMAAAALGQALATSA